MYPSPWGNVALHATFSHDASIKKRGLDAFLHGFLCKAMADVMASLANEVRGTSNVILECVLDKMLSVLVATR